MGGGGAGQDVCRSGEKAERRNRGILTDKKVFCRHQACRKLERRRKAKMVRRRHSKTSNCALNLLKIRGGRQLRAVKELSRDHEGGFINSLGDRDYSIILQN